MEIYVGGKSKNSGQNEDEDHDKDGSHDENGVPGDPAHYDQDGRSFWAHKDLLCSRSPFFTNALREEWKEGQDNKVELPDDDPDIFAMYMHMLYTGKVPIINRTVTETKDLQDVTSENAVKVENETKEEE